MPPPPFFHFLTSPLVPPRPREGKKGNEPLNIENRNNNRTKGSSFRSKKIFNYILHLIYFSGLPMCEWIRNVGNLFFVNLRHPKRTDKYSIFLEIIPRHLAR